MGVCQVLAERKVMSLFKYIDIINKRALVFVDSFEKPGPLLGMLGMMAQRILSSQWERHQTGILWNLGTEVFGLGRTAAK